MHNGVPSNPHRLLSSAWESSLTSPDGIKENQLHYWGKDPSILSTTSSPESFVSGSGTEIYNSTIIPAIESAESEVIFVTCFWAPSTSLNYLSSALIQLSNQTLNRSDHASKVRVRLCLSSRSLFQKLTHTSSPTGYVYPPGKWLPKLGLPRPEALRGLDLEIKSVFIFPFSVMHPKYVIIDRQRAILPSCNLSHETWLEGCISLTGPAVDSLFQFWQHNWSGIELPPLPSYQPTTVSRPSFPTTLLPSPHHRFPSFRPFLSFPAPPPTPLNILLLELISRARISVTFLTPNLTSPPVLSAINAALLRGISIQIITNRRMMILEQLATAGTVTEICVRRLLRQYRKMTAARSRPHGSESEEAPTPKPGTLKIGYFISSRPSAEEGLKKSHVKCTIIDDEVVILGSGNMDRASWFTSQELGIAFEGKPIVKDVWKQLETQLEGRVEKYFGW